MVDLSIIEIINCPKIIDFMVPARFLWCFNFFIGNVQTEIFKWSVFKTDHLSIDIREIAFLDWKGNEDQTDDIVLIGVRI
jgi:hypothetical protein